jgi:hypothetical protein
MVCKCLTLLASPLICLNLKPKIAENNSIKAQARAIVDMAIATLEWTTIIWNLSMMALFSMPNDQL